MKQHSHLHRALNSRANNQGMALVISLILITVAVLAITMMGARLMSQRNLVDRYTIFSRAMDGAEAAVAASRVQLEQGTAGRIGIGNSWTPSWTNNQFVVPSFSATGMDPLTMAGMPTVTYAAYANAWASDGRDNNGDGVVDDSSERWMYTVYGMGKDGDDTRAAEVVYRARDVNVWRNAIFAGTGQSGGLVNGNVSIHGSVHLLGTNLLTGVTAIDAIDLSGTSLIHNNYADVPASLGARVPALPLVNFGGENISTLEAVLRVKKGYVGMSGNSEIGEPNVAGNSYKETMDGVYVNDGYNGTSVVPDGSRGDPKNLWSDNGWDEYYDLGDKVAFPLLTDPWRDPTSGATTPNAATGLPYTHQDYFNQVLEASPTVTNDGTYVGDMTIDARGSNLYWNATQNIKSTTLPGTLPPATDDYVYFNASTNVLRVNGQIHVTGKLEFLGQGNDRSINYSGRGAFLADGDVKIDTDLLTCNNGDPTNTAASFPVNNIIGIMTPGTLTVGSTAQCSIMGAFYGQTKVVSAKQTNVMGTFVGGYFDMGTNVPSIWQVPTLADNLPLGMIGNYPILSTTPVSWREL